MWGVPVKIRKRVIKRNESRTSVCFPVAIAMLIPILSNKVRSQNHTLIHIPQFIPQPMNQARYRKITRWEIQSLSVVYLTLTIISLTEIFKNWHNKSNFSINQPYLKLRIFRSFKLPYRKANRQCCKKALYWVLISNSFDLPVAQYKVTVSLGVNIDWKCYSGWERYFCFLTSQKHVPLRQSPWPEQLATHIPLIRSEYNPRKYVSIGRLELSGWAVKERCAKHYLPVLLLFHWPSIEINPQVLTGLC
jgi:hypothetical protein